MSEFLPPPPELREQLGETAPRAETLAERIGDRLSQWFGRGRENDRGGFLSEAVSSAMETFSVRMALTLAIPIFSGMVIFIYLSAAQSAGELINTASFRSLWYQWDWTRSFETAATVIFAAIASVAGIVSAILPLAETERRGPKLNWAICLFIVFGTICFTASFLPALVLVTGQFGIHWMIHSNIRLRERRAEWAEALVRAAGREERGGDSLLFQNYGGIGGIEGRAEKRPADARG